MKHYFAIPILMAFLSCTASGPSNQDDPSPQSPPQGPSEAAKSEVELGDSFLIPEAKLSHTPSVVLTEDGTKMVTATAEGEIVVFAVPSRKILKRVKLPEKISNAVSIDASGRYAVWGLETSGTVVIEIESGKVIARDGSLRAQCVAVSPDAKQVAVSRGQGLEIRELLSLGLIRSLTAHNADITNLAWSRDGKLLGSTADDGRLRVDDVSKRKACYEVKKAESLYAVAFHPSGGYVAYGGKDNRVYQYELAAAKEEVISKNQPFYITCLGYSPDGDRLAVGDESCDIWLYKLKPNGLTFHSKHHNECWLNSVAWAPDNETFLFGCRPNAHQGTPTLYDPLALAEASRARDVQGKRETLLLEIDAQIPKTKDVEQGKALNDYRKFLSSEGKMVVEQGSQYTMADFPSVEVPMVQASSAGGPLIGATFSLSEPQVSTLTPAPTVKLPPAFQQLAKDHDEALKKEIERLKANFCINQWKVKKD
jgi:hypothetical protein